MRWGDEGKDYFWITDTHPTMIMHPYLPELDGQDLTTYKDKAGKHLFVEMVDEVETDGSGFVEYYWQYKDDPSRIVPKLSYVQEFKPWQWVVGTGIYVDDVDAAIASRAAQPHLCLGGHRHGRRPAPALQRPPEPQDRAKTRGRRAGSSRNRTRSTASW